MARPQGKASAGRSVLVMRHDRIGDLVLALPLVEGLKRAGARVGVLAAPANACLLQADPRVDTLISDGPGAAQAIRAAAFDAALVLWANARNALLALRAGVPVRVGPSLRPYSLLFTRRLPVRRGRGWEHESELNFAFGRALGLEGPAPEPRVFLPADAEARARAWLKAKAPQGRGPLVLLHPGTGGSAEPWPAGRFAELGRRLAAAWGARLVVTGSPRDAGAVAECAAALGPGRTAVCDGLDLAAFGALLGNADLFVAASTGPLHLAAARGTPVLGFYPPVRAMSALRWGPRGSRRAVLSPAGLGFRMPADGSLRYLDRISVSEAEAACGFLLRPRS